MNFYKNKTALVTGASSGIGERFVRVLARKGCDLILVARSEDKLREIAEELSARHGIKAHVIAQDLAQPGAASHVERAVSKRGLRVDILINNAGFATLGAFEKTDAELLHAQIMVNVMAVVELARAFLPAMVERKSGILVNIASTAAFAPIPQQAVYGATKAFVLSWSEALWVENRERGVKVLALCPGATDTGFFDRVGHDVTAHKDTAAVVVRCAMKALHHDQPTVVVGKVNSFFALIYPRLMSRKTFALNVGRVIKKFWISGSD